jgi:hypothetical protein
MPFPQFSEVEPGRISKISQLPAPGVPTDRPISVGCKVVPVVSDKRQLIIIGLVSYLKNKNQSKL